jgi:hypothetical protein
LRHAKQQFRNPVTTQLLDDGISLKTDRPCTGFPVRQKYVGCTPAVVGGRRNPIAI